MNSVQTSGMDALMKKLKSVSDNADRIVENGLLKAGHKVRNRAVNLAPADTGALRNSIQVEQPAPLAVTVGTNLEYALYVEYGTGTQGDPAVAHTNKEQWSYQDEDGNYSGKVRDLRQGKSPC